MQDNNMQEITDIFKNYLSTKEIDFKAMILKIYSHKNIYNLVDKNDLDNFKKCFITLYKQTHNNTSSTADEYDQIMNIESTCNDAFAFIADLEKIKKILTKNKIKSDYIKLIKIAAKVANQDIKKYRKKLIDQRTIPAYKRISPITKNKKKIIREYLKLGFGMPNEIIIKDLFNKFKLSSTKWEIKKLLKECLENAELEDFEKNLGIKQKKKIGDFKHLSGHQFEDYLKELFLILGYKVIRTKLSSDQGADLIINKDEQKTVVQAKKYSGNVTNKAIQEVVASKEHYNANKAMVVTTGYFTNSAIELAKSNKVELWDNNKLNNIISEINTSSKNNQGFRQNTFLEKESNSVPTKCPYCDADIKLPLDDLPAMNSTRSLSCPKCTANMMMTIDEKDYYCDGCKISFKTIKERVEHQKSCETRKDRLFTCKLCNKELKLDDAEFDKLNAKGQVTTECPFCKNSYVFIND